MCEAAEHIFSQKKLGRDVGGGGGGFAAYKKLKMRVQGKIIFKKCI